MGWKGKEKGERRGGRKGEVREWLAPNLKTKLRPWVYCELILQYASNYSRYARIITASWLCSLLNHRKTAAI